MRRIENPELAGSSTLLKALLNDEAEMDCLDSGLGRQPGPVQALNEQINSLRTVLLLRMGKGATVPDDETLLQELVRAHVDSVNSGEDKSPEARDKIDQLTAQIMDKASQTEVLQTT